LEIVFEIAGRYQRGKRWLEERCRLGFARGIEAGKGDLVARARLNAGRNQVE